MVTDTPIKVLNEILERKNIDNNFNIFYFTICVTYYNLKVSILLAICHPTKTGKEVITERTKAASQKIRFSNCIK